MDDASAELLARLVDGDQDAGGEIFQRYIERLTLLARTRLSPRLAARADPEDIVLSAYRSFFVKARAGRFALQRSGDLWRLLVATPLHKLYHNVQFHTAEKRSIDAEQPPSSEVAARDFALSREPSPDEAVALADELQMVMSELDAFGRRVLELRLQGEQLAAIAADTGRSERTVRRRLEEIRRLLAGRIGSGVDEGP